MKKWLRCQIGMVKIYHPNLSVPVKVTDAIRTEEPIEDKKLQAL